MNKQFKEAAFRDNNHIKIAQPNQKLKVNYNNNEILQNYIFAYRVGKFG